MLDSLSTRSAHSFVTTTALLVLILVAGCALTKREGIGKPVAWSSLSGWQDERHAEAWPALIQSCNRLATQGAAWSDICREVELLPTPNDPMARVFFESRFVPHKVLGKRGKKAGLITGYYEPVLEGSLVRTERFRYPLYGRPPNLITVDLGELFPELRGRPVRGRLEGTRVVPYFSRAEIDHGEFPLAGQELAWVDDPVGLFFLHIQGSGRIRLPDGQTLAVGYVDQNGHPYISIGKRLLEIEAMEPEDVTLYSIRNWLAAHPEQAEILLSSNPSYVFFTLRDAQLPGPLGSLNVPLTAERSIAVDPTYIPLGLPVWLDTTLPETEKPYRRLLFAQDTGGAIKGAVRVDVFFGQGQQAEQLAGTMKQEGRLFVLLPAARSLAAK